MSDENERVFLAIRWTNAVAFLLASATLFALSVHPLTSGVGLLFFCWLLVSGTLALVFEERALTAATALRPGVCATELFGRRGRRRLRENPDYFFESADYERYRRRTRDVTRVAMLSALALLVATVAVSVDDVLETKAAIDEARIPWWRRG